MRIPQSLIITQHTQVKSQQGQSSNMPLDYHVGEKLNAIVLNVMENLIQLNVDGEIVHAKQVGEHIFKQGDNITLEVVGKSAQVLEVKLEGEKVALNVNHTLHAQLESQLTKLGMPINDKNIMILKSMHEQGLSITKENIQQLQQNISALNEVAKELSSNPIQREVEWELPLKALVIKLTTSSDISVDKNQEKVSSTVSQTQEILQNETKNQTTPQVKVPLNTKNEEAEALLFNTGDRNIDKSQIQSATSQEHATIPLLKDGEKTHLSQAVKTLNQNLMETFVKLAEEGSEKNVQTLAFMNKNNIAPTMINTVLTANILNGKMGIMSSLSDILGSVSDKLPPELKESLERLILSIPKFSELSDTLDGDVLKQLVEDAVKVQQGLSQLKVVSETGEKSEHIEVIKQGQALLSESPIQWQAIQIPVQLQRQIEDIEVYIKGDEKKGGKFNSDNGLIYIALNTQNMSLVRVKIQLKKEAIHISFISGEEEVKTFMQHAVEGLRKSLSAVTNKHITFDFSSSESMPNIAEFDKIEIEQLTAFDIKV